MAKEHPRYQFTEWPDYEFHEFPMMVYPGADDPLKPYDAKGKVLPGVIVNNAAEADTALGIDRSEEPEAGAPEPKPKAGKAVPSASPGVSRMETEDDQHTALNEEAATLAIPKFDKSWSLARKQDAIDTFKGAGAVV